MIKTSWFTRFAKTTAQLSGRPAAIQIKLDELIRVTNGHNALMDLEELDQEALEAFHAKYRRLASAARSKRASGVDDTNSPEPR